LILDTGVTDEQIRTRILAENYARKDLSLLEVLRFFAAMFEAGYRDDQAERVGRQAGMEGLPLRLHLAHDLSVDDMERLFKIEQAHNIEQDSSFKFSLMHVSDLWQWCEGDKKTFLTAAASVAYGEFKVKDLNKEFTLTLTKQPNNIQWVTNLFPDLAPRPLDEKTEDEKLDAILRKRGSGGTSVKEGTTGGAKGKSKEQGAKENTGPTDTSEESVEEEKEGTAEAGATERTTEGGATGPETPPNPNGGTGLQSRITQTSIESVVKDTIWLACPHCHKSIPFEYKRPQKEHHSLTQIGFKEDGLDKSDEIELEIESKPVTKKCRHCSEEFVFKLAPQGGRNVVAVMFETPPVAAKAKEEKLEPYVLAYSNNLAAASVCQGWYAIQHGKYFVYHLSGELRKMTAAEKGILDGKKEQAPSRGLSETAKTGT
jgi:hypothetical protein